jgi:hypothetical protein
MINPSDDGGGTTVRLWHWLDTHELAFSCVVAAVLSAVVVGVAVAAHLLSGV